MELAIWQLHARGGLNDFVAEMVLASYDCVGTVKVIGLIVDFLAESASRSPSALAQDKESGMEKRKTDLLCPSSPHLGVAQLGAFGVIGRGDFRGLTEPAYQIDIPFQRLAIDLGKIVNE